VIESDLAGFVNPSEWTGTVITFEISPAGPGTEVRFTHEGLRPEIDCFESCSSAWAFFIHGSLKRLIMTGVGPTSPPWA
jgi:hypothetical protein